MPDLFDHFASLETERLIKAGWKQMESFSGLMWVKPDGSGMFTQAEAIRQLNREEQQQEPKPCK